MSFSNVAHAGPTAREPNESLATRPATYQTVRRAIIILAGFAILATGLAMIVLPGPAILVIPAGLSLLAGEYVWARRLLSRLTQLKQQLLTTGMPLREIARLAKEEAAPLLRSLNPHIIAAIATAMIAFAQHLAGIEISFSIFYLLPVALIAVRRGFRLAVGWAAICASAWLAVDIHSGHTFSHPLIPIWNALVRASYFTIAAFAIARARIASERLQSISDLKSEMLTLVSHEFGNSLATMKMSAYLLRELARPSSERESELLDVLDRNIDGMAIASANFLNRARLESGRFSLDIKPLCVQEMAQSAAASFRAIIATNRIAFKVSMPSDPIHVLGDHAAMELILRNILGNALKYTPAGGSVTIGVSLTQTAGPAPLATIWIQDSGIGISPEDQANIVSGFFRSKEGRAHAKGYGIGLKVTHDLISSHGSRLEVFSAPGMGARFSFQMPTVAA